MQLHKFSNSKIFSDRTSTYLLQHQAEHNLLLGITNTLVSDPDRYLKPPFLATVDAQDSIVAVAIQTPPYKLVLSKVKELDALKLIATYLSQNHKSLPGVSGLVTESQSFAQIWQELTGQTYQLTMQLRIHQLTSVQPVATAKGCLRLATFIDRAFLLEWFKDFVDEAVASSLEDAERFIDYSIRKQTLFVWENSIPVSFACGSLSAGYAARIGPVYTPPQYRRQGYATACVAALSQHLLDRGCDSCYLFTDLANPTSNHIYQEIGYRPVCDWHDYSFI
ncbi:MAG TPA: GNAT family N-acetyltransferase [Oculatellaceae cyanobacterium]|jgi:predicted GNAT family acetyltransferase